MARQKMEFPAGIVDVIEATRARGTILCAGSSAGQNGMTIGWISIGSIWGRPSCTVLVRPSRHTYRVIEAADSFTVNLLSRDYQDAVDLFGERSGRELDKFSAAGLTLEKGMEVDSPYINEAGIVIECGIVFKQPMDAARIVARYVREAYPEENYHTMYFGQIVAMHAL